MKLTDELLPKTPQEEAYFRFVYLCRTDPKQVKQFIHDNYELLKDIASYLYDEQEQAEIREALTNRAKELGFE